MGLRSRNKVNVTFSMSSLTDIVFLLLIFFIILSTLISPPGEEVDLPNTESEHVAPKATIAVTIDTDLNYVIDKIAVNKSDVGAIIKEKSVGLDKPQVILYVDKAVPTGETIEFLSMCRKNNFGIVVATKKPKK